MWTANVVLVLAYSLIVPDIVYTGGCEVCNGFLEKLYQTLKTKYKDFTPATVENELNIACRVARGKESRLCYYLGATSDAATKITSEVTRPLSYHVPVHKICEKLQKKDSQICELRYEKQVIDLSSSSLIKLKVVELKNILQSWGETCRACFEKTDYVNVIQELAPKYTSHKRYSSDL